MSHQDLRETAGEVVKRVTGYGKRRYAVPDRQEVLGEEVDSREDCLCSRRVEEDRSAAAAGRKYSAVAVAAVPWEERLADFAELMERSCCSEAEARGQDLADSDERAAGAGQTLSGLYHAAWAGTSAMSLSGCADSWAPQVLVPQTLPQRHCLAGENCLRRTCRAATIGM